MNYISWIMSDTKESIKHKYSKDLNATPCMMLLPNGEVICEHYYRGDGIFGGRDYFIEIANSNKFVFADGTLNYDEIKNRNLLEEVKDLENNNFSKKTIIKMIGMFLYEKDDLTILKPKLVSEFCTAKYEDLADSEICPNKGF